MSYIEEFLKDHRIEEVECLVPDMAGIARGKILPADKFVRGIKRGLRIPEAIFVQTVNGRYPHDSENVIDDAMSDVYLEPDPQSIRVVPWYPEPTAQILCDAYHFGGEPVAFSARHVLKRVLELYGDEHPAMARVYYSRGLALRVDGRPAEAVSWFRRSFAINTAHFGAGHNLALRSAQQMAELLVETGDPGADNGDAGNVRW